MTNDGSIILLYKGAKTMSNLFSRNQVIKAIGAFLAGAVTSKAIANEPAQAQSNIGTFSQVIGASSNGSDKPQLLSIQSNNQDFARLRFLVHGKSPWDIATGSSDNVMNFFNSVAGNVMTLKPNGNLSIKGALTQGSSRTLKENITELSSKEALETLVNLNPVKFTYKADTDKVNHVGFIAEDVPDLVATSDRKGLSAMDIVGVLTKAVQEQQKMISTLTEKVTALETKNPVQ
jgi:Chaperone of endosialidase